MFAIPRAVQDFFPDTGRSARPISVALIFINAALSAWRHYDGSINVKSGINSMFSRIICAIGLGPREKAEHILSRARDLLDSTGEIIVLHVVESVPQNLAQLTPSNAQLNWINEVEDKLKSLCNGLDVETSCLVKVGRAAPTVLDVAREQKADLIIVGSHVQDITDALFGSIVDRITRGAACSVLVDRH